MKGWVSYHHSCLSRRVRVLWYRCSRYAQSALPMPSYRRLLVSNALTRESFVTTWVFDQPWNGYETTIYACLVASILYPYPLTASSGTSIRSYTWSVSGGWHGQLSRIFKATNDRATGRVPFCAEREGKLIERLDAFRLTPSHIRNPVQALVMSLTDSMAHNGPFENFKELLRRRWDGVRVFLAPRSLLPGIHKQSQTRFYFSGVLSTYLHCVRIAVSPAAF